MPHAHINRVSYDTRVERRLFGSGEVLDPLAWDVHLYLALNGAVHDAAIAAVALVRQLRVVCTPNNPSQFHNPTSLIVRAIEACGG